MNNYFLISMILVIVQSANFVFAAFSFFTSSPFTVMFAGAVLIYLCFVAFTTYKRP